MKDSLTKLTFLLIFHRLPAAILIISIHFAATSAVDRTRHLGNETDRGALLAIKSRLVDHRSCVLSSWNNSIHHCDWEGVTCGRKHKRVTALDLNSRGLVGHISPFIGNLSFLTDVELYNNSLIGQIPPDLGRLFRLRTLRLYNNSLDGEIPANLSGCIDLQWLALGQNKLEGKLPFELKALSKFNILSIYSNNFTGNLFEVVANISSLEVISVAYNAFTGSIPTDIGKMRNLSAFVVVGNELSGTIPTSILNCSMLGHLTLGGNNLRGELPPDIGLKLHHLVILNLFDNQFSGAFPYSVLNLTNFQNLDLDSNHFVGRVPQDFGHLYNLEFLGLTSNHLEGDINFVGSLVNCSKLQDLELSENKFTGVLPGSIANLSTGLRRFSFELNRIRGKLPQGKLRNLEFLDFSSSSLKGNIPDIFKNLSRLSKLYLNDNQLEGCIPPSLGDCQSLLVLDLSSNRLNGTLVDNLFEGSSKLISINLSNNLLEGSIPLEISKQINLVDLSVSQNKLFGEIPYGLGDCSTLQTLDIHGNIFHGSIPSSFSLLGSLQSVDLSRNNLSGVIPDFFSKIPLHSLNLSQNDFEGEVPTGGVFANTSAISLDGNIKLCGGIPRLHLPICIETKETGRRRKTSHSLKWTVSMATTLIGVLIIAIWLYLTCHRRRTVLHSSVSRRETFMQVSYDMLLKATNGFSTNNLVGAGSFGSVFRGSLNGKPIAIKVLNLQTRGASNSFMAECNALRNIRHRNLVGIITTCSSIDFERNDFKALVYEFMPNGSLDGLLHGHGAKKLTLVERMDIAIDVAYALSYLHHDCEIPIVHCDLKPSNILLDNDMVAHVGDFGLAKFFAQPQHPNQSSSIGIRGTIGYAAPEYGIGSEPSPDGDIYSYGITLLELMTGKRPTDNIFQEDYNLHTYAEAAFSENNVLQIIDPTLGDEEILTAEVGDIRTVQLVAQRRAECILSVISVGVACSRHLPQDRMKITDVISKLRVARDNLCNARFSKGR